MLSFIDHTRVGLAHHPERQARRRGYACSHQWSNDGIWHFHWEYAERGSNADGKCELKAKLNKKCCPYRNTLLFVLFLRTTIFWDNFIVIFKKPIDLIQLFQRTRVFTIIGKCGIIVQKGYCIKEFFVFPGGLSMKKLVFLFLILLTVVVYSI